MSILETPMASELDLLTRALKELMEIPVTEVSESQFEAIQALSSRICELLTDEITELLLNPSNDNDGKNA